MPGHRFIQWHVYEQISSWVCEYILYHYIYIGGIVMCNIYLRHIKSSTYITLIQGLNVFTLIISDWEHFCCCCERYASDLYMYLFLIYVFLFQWSTKPDCSSQTCIVCQWVDGAIFFLCETESPARGQSSLIRPIRYNN